MMNRHESVVTQDQVIVCKLRRRRFLVIVYAPPSTDCYLIDLVVKFAATAAAKTTKCAATCQTRPIQCITHSIRTWLADGADQSIVAKLCG